jgi:hypothetical protein
MNATFAAVFIALYVGHMIGDHVVQTDWQAANKSLPGRAGYWALAAHVRNYVAAQWVALMALGLVTGAPWLTEWAPVWGLLVSGLTHGFIDRRWPVQWLCRRTGSEAFGKLAGHGLNGAYLVDQTLHIASLFVAALLVAGLSGAA